MVSWLTTEGKLLCAGAHKVESNLNAAKKSNNVLDFSSVEWMGERKYEAVYGFTVIA